MKSFVCLAFLLFATATAAAGETTISIASGQWRINGRITYAGAPAEGLLMNVRMVNAVFEDANDQTRPKGFDADANTAAFIKQIPITRPVACGRSRSVCKAATAATRARSTRRSIQTARSRARICSGCGASSKPATKAVSP